MFLCTYYWVWLWFTSTLSPVRHKLDVSLLTLKLTWNSFSCLMLSFTWVFCLQFYKSLNLYFTLLTLELTVICQFHKMLWKLQQDVILWLRLNMLTLHMWLFWLTMFPWTPPIWLSLFWIKHSPDYDVYMGSTRIFYSYYCLHVTVWTRLRSLYSRLHINHQIVERYSSFNLK